MLMLTTAHSYSIDKLKNRGVLSKSDFVETDRAFTKVLMCTVPEHRHQQAVLLKGLWGIHFVT